MMFFVLAGQLFRTSAAFLIVCGIGSRFLYPTPNWLTRAVTVSAFILIATSVVVLSAYAVEVFFAYRSTDPYQFHSYEIRYQDWFYWFQIIATLLPQLFWFPRFRRHPLPLIGISLGAVSPYLFEYAVVGITEYSRPS